MITFQPMAREQKPSVQLLDLALQREGKKIKMKKREVDSLFPASPSYWPECRHGGELRFILPTRAMLQEW